MSAYNIKWIWDQQITAVQKLVLFALNEHCNPAHGDWRCFPSQKTLSKLTGLSDRAIRSNMVELQKLKLITVAHQHDGTGSQKVNMYWLNAPFIGVQQGFESSADQGDTPRKEIPTPPEGDSGAPGRRFLQNPLIEPLKKKHSGEPEFDQFWLAYPRKVKKPEALKAWKATAKDRPPLAELLDHLSNRAWPSDPKFIPHPSTFLRGHQWADDLIVIPRAAAGSWR